MSSTTELSVFLLYVNNIAIKLYINNLNNCQISVYLNFTYQIDHGIIQVALNCQRSSLLLQTPV